MCQLPRMAVTSMSISVSWANFSGRIASSSQSGNTTAIRGITVREAGVSQHQGAGIKGSLKHPVYHNTIILRGLTVAQIWSSIIPRNERRKIRTMNGRFSQLAQQPLRSNWREVNKSEGQRQIYCLPSYENREAAAGINLLKYLEQYKNRAPTFRQTLFRPTPFSPKLFVQSY